MTFRLWQCLKWELCNASWGTRAASSETLSVVGNVKANTPLLSAVYLFYSSFSAQYWHDPLNLTNFVHGSHYLAIVNNEVEDKESLYK